MEGDKWWACVCVCVCVGMLRPRSEVNLGRHAFSIWLSWLLSAILDLVAHRSELESHSHVMFDISAIQRWSEYDLINCNAPIHL